MKQLVESICEVINRVSTQVAPSQNKLIAPKPILNYSFPFIDSHFETCENSPLRIAVPRACNSGQCR